jgi:hypothetical protein
VPGSDENVRGIVHGKVIQLESEIGLPDGQEVTVSVRPVAPKEETPGDGLRQSAGAWDDDPDGLDAYLAENRRARQLDRPDIDP